MRVKAFTLAVLSVIATSCGGGGEGSSSPTEPQVPNQPPPPLSVGGSYSSANELSGTCTSGAIQPQKYSVDVVVGHEAGKAGATFKSSELDAIIRVNNDGSFSHQLVMDISWAQRERSEALIGSFSEEGFSAELTFHAWIPSIDEPCDIRVTMEGRRKSGTNSLPG